MFVESFVNPSCQSLEQSLHSNRSGDFAVRLVADEVQVFVAEGEEAVEAA